MKFFQNVIYKFYHYRDVRENLSFLNGNLDLPPRSKAISEPAPT